MYFFTSSREFQAENTYNLGLLWWKRWLKADIWIFGSYLIASSSSSKGVDKIYWHTTRENRYFYVQKESFSPISPREKIFSGYSNV